MPLSVDTGSPFTASSAAPVTTLSATPAVGFGHTWLALVACSTSGVFDVRSNATTGVSGGGLTWTRRQVTATTSTSPNQFVAELWTAVGPADGTSIVYTPGNAANVSDAVLGLFSLSGSQAPTSWVYQSQVNDSGVASAISATHSLTSGSLLFGAGSDYFSNAPRTYLANTTQTVEIDNTVAGGNTDFVCQLSNPSAGSVTFGTSAPATGNLWVFGTVEVLASRLVGEDDSWNAPKIFPEQTTVSLW